MRVLLPIIAILLVVGLSASTYILDETEQAVVTQFGDPVGEPKTEPGLYFKVPFVQEIHRFEKRYMEWDGEVNELTTRDKRFITVDTYARWRITDPLLFIKRLRDERGAQGRLDDILDGATRNAMADADLVEIVRSSNRTPEASEALVDEEATLDPIEKGREGIRLAILANAKESTTDLGIEILDLQFKRLNYNDEVRSKVYERMISERQRIATRFRSEGDGEAARTLGEKERELKRIQSEAFREAEEIRGGADAQATEIYASAYDQNAASREFYDFMKTLETYEQVIDGKTSLILSTDSDLFGILKDGGN